jgi:hypothetical protein
MPRWTATSASPSLGNVDDVGLSTQSPPHDGHDTPVNDDLILKGTAPVAAVAGFGSSVTLYCRAGHHVPGCLNGTGSSNSLNVRGSRAGHSLLNA